VLVGFGALWLLFLFNFSGFTFGSGDASVQYGFVQRLFGDASSAQGYYFGFALVEAPFYAVGKLLDFIGVHTLDGVRVRSAAISIGIGLLVLPGAGLLVWLLRRLRLPASPTVLVGSIFGTSLFYYGVYQPGKNHVADALLFLAAIAVASVYFRADVPSARLAALLGAVLGFSVSVRYFAGAEAVALGAVLLWLRRWRDAGIVALVCGATFGALALIPLALGVSLTAGGVSTGDALVFAPLNPVRMLFTDHRGLVVWSPVTAIAAVGWIHVIRSRPQDRRFFAAVLAMGFAIVGSYAFVQFWDGTYSFSQRFYTPLFALVAIGLAGAFETRPRLVTALTSACVAWSLFLCFNFVTIGGWRFPSRHDSGATALAGLPRHEHYSAGAYAWGIYHQSRLVRSWLPWPGSTPTHR
jgi:hypothetical protein